MLVRLSADLHQHAGQTRWIGLGVVEFEMLPNDSADPAILFPITADKYGHDESHAVARGAIECARGLSKTLCLNSIAEGHDHKKVVYINWRPRKGTEGDFRGK